jgi:hypothetical protein
MPPLDQLYFAWQYGQVASVENRNLTRTYWNLLRILSTKEFVWSHPRDANFAQYGVELRRLFVQETNPELRRDPGFMDEPCDMLELMIVLATKLSHDDLEERSREYWFWDMIDNLGLNDFNDARLPDADRARNFTGKNRQLYDQDFGYIHGVLDRVLNREYNSKGEGGLFPLRSTKKNQRREELLYQLENYLSERV